MKKKVFFCISIAFISSHLSTIAQTSTVPVNSSNENKPLLIEGYKFPMTASEYIAAQKAYNEKKSVQAVQVNSLEKRLPNDHNGVNSADQQKEQMNELRKKNNGKEIPDLKPATDQNISEKKSENVSNKPAQPQVRENKASKEQAPVTASSKEEDTTPKVNPVSLISLQTDEKAKVKNTEPKPAEPAQQNSGERRRSDLGNNNQ
ncbi:MAG: hypothetical protein N2747_08620 [Chitinophagaceae bacterium]|nr:hypothetical protein [Chitinophagaceae bacterium]